MIKTTFTFSIEKHRCASANVETSSVFATKFKFFVMQTKPKYYLHATLAGRYQLNQQRIRMKNTCSIVLN